jgi:hypothetical protein
VRAGALRERAQRVLDAVASVRAEDGAFVEAAAAFKWEPLRQTATKEAARDAGKDAAKVPTPARDAARAVDRAFRESSALQAALFHADRDVTAVVRQLNELLGRDAPYLAGADACGILQNAERFLERAESRPEELRRRVTALRTQIDALPALVNPALTRA